MKVQLKVGMKFKPMSHPDYHGECVSLSEGQFTYCWYNAEGIREMPLFNMKIKEAVDCFELYGWKVLSGLEEELV